MPANNLVPIVGDGMIAGQVADGRSIPAVILDTSQRPDVVEMIRVHRHVSSGDARSVWALVERQPDDVLLMLEFERPVATTVLLRFSIEQSGGLVDMAVKAGGIYLQAGKPGDRLKHDLDQPKVLVDLPEGGFLGVWEEAFLERMTAVMSAKLGLTRRKARPHARRLIEDWRRVGSFRMPQS